ncbi:MAG: gamma carbonic anhydrase family protein [Desulfitibacter sp. BRH_c19]|nr:MAG: gamma carbonic anhydrase family protein [Desulfitibacter sp. BRH_c19]
MINEFRQSKPDLDHESYIAETGVAIGRVKLGFGSSIWYNAVVRGDINYITIGDHSNVQDNAVLHVGMKHPVEVGDYTSIAHGAVLHGCTIGNYCLVGMNAVVLNGALVGDNCMIGAGTVITQNMVIPVNSLVVGTPGKVVREIKPEELKEIHVFARRYEYLWRKYYSK